MRMISARPPTAAAGTNQASSLGEPDSSGEAGIDIAAHGGLDAVDMGVEQEKLGDSTGRFNLV